MVYVPCSLADTLSAVKGLAIVGGVISLSSTADAPNHTAQLPVFYYMDNGQLITPNYTDLTYESSDTASVTVSASGLLTGVAGTQSATVSASIVKGQGTPQETTLTASVPVLVQTTV